jgi:hypothetical protein
VEGIERIVLRTMLMFMNLNERTYKMCSRIPGMN